MILGRAPQALCFRPLCGLEIEIMNVKLQVPPFELATEWLNRRGTARQTKGHPTLVHVSSVISETSKTNLAQIAQLRDQRTREGLRVVAVHVPQSDAEKDPRTVR